jgi:hypothetical protein
MAQFLVQLVTLIRQRALSCLVSMMPPPLEYRIRIWLLITRFVPGQGVSVMHCPTTIRPSHSYHQIQCSPFHPLQRRMDARVRVVAGLRWFPSAMVFMGRHNLLHPLIHTLSVAKTLQRRWTALALRRLHSLGMGWLLRRRNTPPDPDVLRLPVIINDLTPL